VELIAGERLIDQSQLRTLAQILETANLKLSCVHTTRRPTAVAAVTIGYSVQQQSPDLALGAQNIPNLKFSPAGETKQLSPPLVLTTTLRSGSDVRHPGHVILIGDLNPGGAIVADGDILVWGRLRGIAHAGAKGNRSACIMALQMEPTQLRIADQVARAPSAKLDEFYPEVASIVANGIQIVRAYDFSR
jgi:septum site-determining protein MinC